MLDTGVKKSQGVSINLRWSHVNRCAIDNKFETAKAMYVNRKIYAVV